jgi:hypothetical protein
MRRRPLDRGIEVRQVVGADGRGRGEGGAEGDKAGKLEQHDFTDP